MSGDDRREMVKRLRKTEREERRRIRRMLLDAALDNARQRHEQQVRDRERFEAYRQRPDRR